MSNTKPPGRASQCQAESAGAYLILLSGCLRIKHPRRLLRIPWPDGELQPQKKKTQRVGALPVGQGNRRMPHTGISSRSRRTRRRIIPKLCHTSNRRSGLVGHGLTWWILTIWGPYLPPVGDRPAFFLDV